MDIDRRAFVMGGASLAVQAPAAIAAVPSDSLDVRRDFPITASGGIYLNSAYIAPIPRQVVDAGTAFLTAKATRPLKLDELRAECETVRAQFARLINATPDEVALLFSTTDGENTVVNGLDLAAGDNVVIDELHYEAQFVMYQALEATRGVQLRVVKARNGMVEARDFEPLVDRRTRLVSVAWISHQNGFRHDMRPIADVAHSMGALFFTDAIQAVGAIQVDVQAADVDFLSANSYKWLLAGYGAAPLYVRRSVLDRIRIDRFGAKHVTGSRPDGSFEINRTARKFEYSSRAFGDVFALRAGLAYLEQIGVARIESHTVGLALRLQQGLARQGHRLLTPAGNRASIVTFLGKQPSPELRSRFDAAQVDVTIRNGQVRISPALFNSNDDVDRCLEITAKLA
ncbi:MAG: aminotransferase class V-fold PLP-dependent enzyme [Rhodospirillales bacterium]|nr:aminotransferase class V-fold PLP-dependent enzyme [Rhodospirillales bacterium]